MLRLLILLLVAGPVWAQAPATLHATLDLRQAIADGWFDPATEIVGLRGDRPPLSWGATLPAEDPDGDGLYTLAPSFDLRADSAVVSFKIKVDGADNPNDGWQEGLNHRVTLRQGEEARVAVAWEDEAPAPPPSFSGHVEVIEGVEAEGLAPRDVYVYLPPGYAEGDRRYPVLYLHDGRQVFDASAGGAEWGMDEAAEALIAAGEVEPLIIVGIANTPARIDEYTPTVRTWRRELARVPDAGSGPAAGTEPDLAGAYAADGDTLWIERGEDGWLARIPESDAWQPLESLPDGRWLVAGITLTFERGADGATTRVVGTKPPEGGLGDRYGAFLIDTLKPLIDRRYRTRSGPEDTGLGGSSLGGLITMHLGLQRPDVFGRLLVASPSVWWDGRWIVGTVAAHSPSRGQRVWIDVGTAEGGSMVPDARALRDALLAAGWSPDLVRYVEAEGAGHSETAWAERAHDMLRFLFPAE